MNYSMQDLFSNLPEMERDFLQELEVSTKELSKKKRPRIITGGNHVTKLFLRECKLKSLPESIGNLKYLQILILERNKLREIPEVLERFTIAII